MAALDKKQIQEFKKLLEELNRKKDKLGQKPILDLDETVENLGVVNELLDVANENLNDLEGSVEGIKESWGSIVDEIKNVNETSGRSVKSFNKLSGIADKLSMSQKGLNELSSRQVSSLITKTKIEAENLKFQQKQLEKKEKAGTLSTKEKKALEEIKGTLGENNGLIQQQINALEAQEKRTKNVERATGLTGVAMKGVSGFLDKIGMSNMGEVFEDANLAAKATAERLTDGGKKAKGFLTKVRAMGSAFKVVGKAIVQNLTDPLVVGGMLIKGFKAVFNFFVDAYKKGEEAAMRISEENVNMARSLGISQRAASKLAGSVAGMGPTTAASKSSIEGIYKAMGSTEKLSGNTLKVFVKLNTMAGMSAESLAKFQKFAKKSGEDAGTLVSEMAKTAGAAIKNNKLAMTQRDLLDETANQSAYVRLQFAGQGPALVKAVAQSKALGLNMKQARDMASSLLNFEDSIAAEMEAELLTGKQLNLEEARALALKGDNVGAAKLIAEQVGGAAEFMSMNVIQQEALAKAAGMGVDEMSNMLSGQQDMKAEGDDLVKNQEEGIKAMTSAVSLREDAENRARRAAEASLSTYQAMKEPVNELKEAFIEIKATLTETLTDEVIKPLVEFLKSEDGKAFIKDLPGNFKSVLESIKGIVKEVGGFMKKYPYLSSILAFGHITLKLVGISPLLTAIKLLGKLPKLLGKLPNFSKLFSKTPDIKSGVDKLGRKFSYDSKTGRRVSNNMSKGGSFFGKMKTGISNVGKSISSSKMGKGVSSIANKINPMKALKSGLIGKAGKFISKGVKGGLIGAILKTGSLVSILAGKGTNLEKAQQILPLGASVIGGSLGSILGSVLPGPGTILGGIAGGLIGDYIGSMPSVQKALAPPLAKALGGNDVAEDFIMRGDKIQKFRKDDIVMGGTNLMGGGEDNAKTIKLLERLVAAVERGGTVTLDGQKVGTAMVAGSYRMQ